MKWSSRSYLLAMLTSAFGLLVPLFFETKGEVNFNGTFLFIAAGLYFQSKGN